MLFQLHVIFQEILWRSKVTFTILTATQYIKKSSSYVKPPPADSLLHYEDHPSLLGVIHLLVSNHTIVAGFLLVLQ